MNSYDEKSNKSEHIHNDSEIAQNKYNNSDPSSDDSISYLKNHSDLSDNNETEADNFIIFWVFFSIFAIFVIIPVVYILSAMYLSN